MIFYTNYLKQKSIATWLRLILTTFLILVSFGNALAGGDASGSIGVYLKVNGTSTWYKVYNPGSWGMSCSGYAFDSASEIPSAFGDITSSLSLEGVGVIGWTNSGNDWVAGKISYTITPGSVSGEYKVGNYGSAGSGKTQEQCTSDNNRLTGYKSTVNLISGLGVGDYTLKITPYAQMQWNDGSNSGTYNSYTRTAKSSTFTIPGYSTTSGTLDFDEVEIDSNSSMSKSTTHYGSKTTATYSISGTNASEFTVTACTATSVTVKFTPTSAGSKTAKVTITDAYSKTYTLTVTGTGKQSCQAPTSVSVTGSETPCVGANETYTATIDDGSKYDLEWVVPDGYTIIEGQGTTSIIVEVGTTSGNITCTATCGNSAPSDEISVAPYTTVAPTINLSTEYVCPGESATITVESPELNVEGLSYKLYNKNDTSTPIAIITEPNTEPVAFTIQEGTYYVTVSHTCGGEKKSTNEKTLQEYQAPAMPAYTSTPATSCKGTPNSDGTITLKNAVGGVTYALDGTNDTEWSRLAAGTHTLSATVDACSSLTREWNIEVGEEDITPSATVSITGKSSFCEGDNTELTCEVETTGVVTAYQWYNGYNPIQTATESTYTAFTAGSYKVVVTVENKGCQDEFWSDEKVVTINPKPNEPVLSIPSPICAGSNFTLPEEDNNQRNITWNVNDRELTNLTAGTHNYTAKIIDVNGCESNEVTYTITVTALPEITSISQDIQEPVFYEDVTLTATATDGAIVKWYEGGEEKATGTTYVVTSSSDASKIVTAKAFLNGCESDFKEHEVTFSAEDCNSVESKDIIINFTHPAQNTNGYPKCQYWGFGTLTYKINGVSDSKELGSETSGTKTITIENISASTITDVKFTAYHSYGDCKAYTKTITLDRGYEYNVTINPGTNAGQQSSQSAEKELVTTSKTDLSSYPDITDPVAKTISVSTTDGEGNIIFSGQVVKIGCAETLTYGFAYSTDANADKSTWTKIQCTNVGNTVGTQFSGSKTELEDETYYVCAYITNSAGTSYGAVTEITVSTTKIPITSVTLTHVKDVNGTDYTVQESENLTYCAGETVWFKLEQNGSKFQDYQWISWPGTDLVGMYAAGTFSFTITDSGNVGIRLKNDANDDWVESNLLEFNTHPVAISPTISFENATICSNSTATLKLGALVVGQSYELYKEIENEGVYSEERVGDVTLTCNSIEDDLEFTGLNESGKYFVKGYTAQCPDYKVSSQTATLEIVDASSVYITLDPTEATTTPWMPAKFTVNASDKYTLNVTKGNPAESATDAEVSQNGNNVSVKIPLPEGATGGEGQYENVVFPDGATTQYTITATLSATGGDDNPCATPASATITLVPYEEECTDGH